MSFVSVDAAALVGLVVLAAVVSFHVLVLVGVIPTTLVWGGQFSNPSEVTRLEFVSIGVLLAAGITFAMRWRSVAAGEGSLIWLICTWVLVGLFTLNTLGNLFAKSVFERTVMTPLTLLLAVLALRLALETVATHG